MLYNKLSYIKGRVVMKEVSIVSFNIRLAIADDGINSFIHRSGAIISKIRKEEPDIIGFQEVYAECADFLIENLPEYHFIFSRRNADLLGEGLLTAVKKELFYIISADYFWLSETPRVPASRFEDQSDCPRIAQCVTVQSKETGVAFMVYNTHLDHIGDEARIEGIKCLMAYAKLQQKLMPTPLFLLGDFNAFPDSETIKYCNEYEEIELVELTEDIPVTFHNFGKKLPDDGVKIDYIYTNRPLIKNKISAEVWDDVKDGIYLSDHYPVVVKIMI